MKSKFVLKISMDKILLINRDGYTTSYNKELFVFHHCVSIVSMTFISIFCLFVCVFFLLLLLCCFHDKNCIIDT